MSVCECVCVYNILFGRPKCFNGWDFSKTILQILNGFNWKIRKMTRVKLKLLFPLKILNKITQINIGNKNNNLTYEK